jgi:NADH:ubiquinone oxidoreductase subunit 5 (subunit L)/multisubunit Na+/H+ antiporter MnhA subunit
MTDYKRLFPFSTVEHVKIIPTAAGLDCAAAHYGAVYQILNHSLTTSFCFFAAGAVLLLLGTQQGADVRIDENLPKRRRSSIESEVVSLRYRNAVLSEENRKLKLGHIAGDSAQS